MATNRASVEIYSTRIPIDGWSGLPLLGIVIAIVMAVPEAAALLAAGVAGGALIGSFLIRRSQER